MKIVEGLPLVSRRQMLGWAGTALLPWGIAARLLAAEPHVTVPVYNTLTDEQEIELGTKFAAQLEKTMPVVSNSLMERYLSGIVNQLAAKSQRPNIPYKIKLVNAAEINAFSIAGGFIYLYRGLVDFIDQEDELVATLAHEIGHIVGRHSANTMLQTFAARRLLQVVLENLPKNNGVVEKMINQFGGPLAMLTMMHISRQDEFEADLLGFYETVRAGWSPQGYLKLFAGLEKLEGHDESLLGPYLRSHPPAPERAAAIQQELTEVTLPDDLNENSFSFRSFKLSMALLPAAQKPRDS